MITVLHSIATLEPGGTEHFLVEHIQNTAADVKHVVFVLRPLKGPLPDRLKKLQIEVISAEMDNVLSLPRAVISYQRTVRASAPQIQHCWSYFPAVLSLFVSAGIPAIWNMRQGLASTRDEKLLTRLAIKLLKKNADRPDLWVYNSEAGLLDHQQKGLSSSSIRLIENGVCTDTFRRDIEKRREVRRRYKIPDDACIILNVSRRHPMKGEEFFIRVATRLLETYPELFIMVCGRSAIAPAYPRLIYAGYQEEIEAFFSAADIYCHSSTRSEGFPNAVAQAMACECFPVATDIGDTKRLLSSNGYCVPPGNFEALLKALEKAISEYPRSGGFAGARERMVELFSSEKVHSEYMNVYRTLFNKAKSSGGPVCAAFC